MKNDCADEANYHNKGTVIHVFSGLLVFIEFLVFKEAEDVEHLHEDDHREGDLHNEHIDAVHEVPCQLTLTDRLALVLGPLDISYLITILNDDVANEGAGVEAYS